MQSKKSKEQGEQEVKFLDLQSFELLKVTPGKAGVVYFDAIINGLSIRGLKVVPLKDGSGDFVAWPSHKGADGKYYSDVYARFRPETEQSLLAAVQEKLDETDK